MQKIYKFYLFVPQFLPIFTAACTIFTYFYQKYTTLNHGLWTKLPSNSVNFKNFTAVNFTMVKSKKTLFLVTTIVHL